MIKPENTETLKKIFKHANHRERLVWSYSGNLRDSDKKLYIECYIALTSPTSKKKNVTVSIVDDYGNIQTFGGKQAKKSKLLSKWKEENYQKLFDMIDCEGLERYFISDDEEFKLI